nr:MAG TPA: hypothetical protein [Caudoviricetes sp.]
MSPIQSFFPPYPPNIQRKIIKESFSEKFSRKQRPTDLPTYQRNFFQK